MEAEAI
jgi:hypothetical protein